MTLLSGIVGPGKLVSPKSVTLIRKDPLPNLSPTLAAKERLANVARAISLLATDLPDPDKWKADVATKQSHGGTNEYIDHPMADGSRVTDHRIKKPDTFSFTGIISDTPTGVLGLTTTPFGVVGTEFFLSRSIEEFEKFIEGFFEPGEPVFIATSLRVMPDMLIDSWQVDRDENSGAAIQISVQAHKALFVSESFGPALIDDDAIFLGAGAGENGGTQAMTPVG